MSFFRHLKLAILILVKLCQLWRLKITSHLYNLNNHPKLKVLICHMRKSVRIKTMSIHWVRNKEKQKVIWPLWRRNLLWIRICLTRSWGMDTMSIATMFISLTCFMKPLTSWIRASGRLIKSKLFSNISRRNSHPSWICLENLWAKTGVLCTWSSTRWASDSLHGKTSLLTTAKMELNFSLSYKGKWVCYYPCPSSKLSNLFTLRKLGATGSKQKSCSIHFPRKSR